MGQARTELSLLFEIQDLDNGECCLSCREGGWLNGCALSGSGCPSRKKTGNKSERISIPICFVCMSPNLLVRRVAQKSMAEPLNL